MGQAGFAQIAITAWVLGAAALGGSSARADSYGNGAIGVGRAPAATGTASHPDSDRGISNYYQEANQVISQDALYTFEKMKSLSLLSKDEDVSVEQFNQKAGGICQSSESKTDCFERLVALERHRLDQVRSAYRQNQEAASNIRTRQDETTGQWVSSTDGTAFGMDEESAKRISNALPKVISTEEIRREVERLAALSTPGFSKYAAEMPRAPSKDDFIIYEKTRLPGSETEYRTSAKICGASPCIDEKAYSKALSDYQDLKALHQGVVQAQALPARPALGEASIRGFETSSKHIQGVLKAKATAPVSGEYQESHYGLAETQLTNESLDRLARGGEQTPQIDSFLNN